MVLLWSVIGSVVVELLGALTTETRMKRGYAIDFLWMRHWHWGCRE